MLFFYERRSIMSDKNLEPSEKKIVGTSQEVDNQLLDDAVKFINEKANETLYKGSIEIGEYILEKFFEGKSKLASSKNPKKQQSFNKLCTREDLVVHPNRLALMVRVASQEKFFTKEEIDTKELSYTHKASLVKLDNNSKKINLVKKCIEKEWSTKSLDDAIKKQMEKLSSTQRPSLIRTTKKYMNKIDGVLNAVKDTGFDFDPDNISKMTPEKRKDLKKNLTDLQKKALDGMNKTKNISEECDKALKDLTDIEAKIKENPPKPGRPPKKK